MGKYDGVEHVGVALRACREELGESQDEVAERLGVTGATLSRWEAGLQEPTEAAHLAAIVRFLTLSREDLAQLVLATKLHVARLRSQDLSREDARTLRELTRDRPPEPGAGQ